MNNQPEQLKDWRKKAAIEQAKREQARRNFMPFVKHNFYEYQESWHHTLIAKKLEEVESGKIKRLAIFMPPRHGKSELCTVQFPAWFLGRNPRKEIISTSYSADLSVEFGRKVRDTVNSIEYGTIFPNSMLSTASKAADHWNTKLGGGYTATGIGGSITGKGAHCLIIDDPFKSRKEADSAVIRDVTWNWYTGTAFTRLAPNGAVILIMCMTGDTKVMMANRSEKELRDIKVNDRILTYDNGKLSTSFIKNWISQGYANIFTIRTSSGKLIKANERHPFLINNNGKLVWIRLKDLTTGQKIVTLKDNGVNGKVKNVSAKDVKKQSAVEDIARPTTIKRSGLMDTVHHRLIIDRVVMGISNIVTGLRSTIMTLLSKSKIINVPYVNDLKERVGENTTHTSALTTTTTPEKSEGYFAMSVTLGLVMQKMKRLLWPWQNTSDFTLDEIVSIKPSGVEEVFDIEVDRTHNFIANGSISGNTRWHDNDLAGRILAHRTASNWHVLELPAIANKDEVIEGQFVRKKGRALWPTRYNEQALQSIKNTIGPYEWSSQYQQNPVDEEAIEFHKVWFKNRPEEEVKKLNTLRYLTVDTAGKVTRESNYIGIVDNRVDREGKWNIKARKYKMDPAQLINYLFVLQEKYNYEIIGIEKTIFTDVLEPYMDEKMMEKGITLPYKLLKHNKVSKELRIRGLIPFYKMGKIYHIDGECEELIPQLIRFPKSADDDIIDALAYQLQIAKAPFGWDDKDFGGKQTDTFGDPVRETDTFDSHSPIGSLDI